MRGRFITFEGIEGVGKTTQAALATEYLQSRGIEVVLTREPGGTPLAEQLREFVLEPRERPIGVTVELLLIFAARASHVADRIRPALRRGRWVLCDRFTDATLAYQGGGSGANMAWIRQLAKIAHPRLAPDRTFLFDAPPAIAMARVADRGNRLDRFEAEGGAFFERVRQSYLDVAAREPARVRVIEAAASQAEVARAVTGELDAMLAPAAA
ncbi:MAG TPA: dTMP kinase [Steroidobacteraceae bacterium]|nr:dTMP kinase [Steroidobacteraceae bacterium]